MAAHGLLRLEQAKQNKTNDSFTFMQTQALEKTGFLVNYSPKQEPNKALVSEQDATKCLVLRCVPKCPKRTYALTFIWSVMSHLPSMSECYGPNGGKASDWLRLYIPNWAESDFVGGVRLTSSDRRDQFEPYGSLFHPNWREVRCS